MKLLARKRVFSFFVGVLGLISVAYACRPQARSGLSEAVAEQAGAPVIAEIQDDGGKTLWKEGQDAPELTPGKKIVLLGSGFGPGPLSAEVPGTGDPANVPEARADRAELSKIMFGRVRALERSMPSYPGRLNFTTLGQAFRTGIDFFYEEFVSQPPTWVSDIVSWSDTKIEVRVPITAYEGPVVVWRMRVTGDGPREFVKDIVTGEPASYVDPNTARVRTFSQSLLSKPFRIFQEGELKFKTTYPILRTEGRPLQSKAVAVKIALDGARRNEKDAPTGRAAAAQYEYGEKIWYAHDWNLGLTHLVLGVDWDGVFGFEPRQTSTLEAGEGRVKEILGLFGTEADEGEPRRVPSSQGYQNPLFASLRQVPLKDRFTGGPINPFKAFGAIPVAAEAGASRLVAPKVVTQAEPIQFKGATPYPVDMSIRLTKPQLREGVARNTGWVGYVYTEAAHPVPGGATRAEDGQKVTSGEWIGFNCSSCHTHRETYEIDDQGTKVTKIFNGLPNPDWKVSFLALSGRARGLVHDEPLPPNFIKADYPKGTKARVDAKVANKGILASAVKNTSALFNKLTKGKSGAEAIATEKEAEALEKASAEDIDRTLMLMNMPRGAAEMTTFGEAGEASPYSNDYFLSPQAIPILTNHTPVRRALSHAEILAGFEGAYLHGQEPDGTRGAMTPRALQDLTLFVSTISQENEVTRRLGLYRWATFKMKRGEQPDDLLGGVREGTFMSFSNDQLGLEPSRFPPTGDPKGGVAELRDAGTGALAERFPKLKELVGKGRGIFMKDCERCHSKDNFDTWTNEDMHPISAQGGAEPVGRFFTPSIWNRKNQSIRTAILQNLFWVQQRGLLGDGHLHSTTDGDTDNVDGLKTLVDPERCKEGSGLYNRLYTINEDDAAPSYRIPVAGKAFTISERHGRASVPNQNLKVTPEQARFVERHAYFTKKGDYYYWDYQKMRREYGVLEYGLPPGDPRVGGLPAAPHPWCADSAQGGEELDALVAFLLTL